jgi:hypothetical protein
MRINKISLQASVVTSVVFGTSGVALAGGPVTLPSGLMGATMEVWSAPIGGGAHHVFGLIMTGPWAGYILENTSAFHGPHLGNVEAITYDQTDNSANNDIGTYTIVNTTVADGYSLGTNNCSDLIMQVTQKADPAFYPGENYLTQPYSVPPPGQPVPFSNTHGGSAVIHQLISDATITGTDYNAYNTSPGYGGGGYDDFYESASYSGCEGICS